MATRRGQAAGRHRSGGRGAGDLRHTTGEQVWHTAYELTGVCGTESFRYRAGRGLNLPDQEHRHLPMNNFSVPAKCLFPGTLKGPASVPGETAEILPRESTLTKAFRSSAFAFTFFGSALRTNSWTTNSTRSARYRAASTIAPATAVKSWYRSALACLSSDATLSMPWQSSSNLSGTRLRGLAAMVFRTYSPAISPNGSSAFASMLTSTLRVELCPQRTRSAWRPSPHESKRTTRSGSPLSKVTPCVSGRDASNCCNSSGTWGLPGEGNHAFASSLALRPSLHCAAPPWGGAMSNQSWTEVMCLAILSIESSFFLCRVVRPPMH